MNTERDETARRHPSAWARPDVEAERREAPRRPVWQQLAIEGYPPDKPMRLRKPTSARRVRLIREELEAG